MDTQRRPHAIARNGDSFGNEEFRLADVQGNISVHFAARSPLSHHCGWRFVGLVFTAAVCLTRPVEAQSSEREISNEPIRLEDFRLSGPPALALLGIAPSSVTR